MNTVDDIRADIRARGFEADTDAQQLVFLNSIQRRIAGSHRWRWTIESQALVVVSGTGDYALASAPAGGHMISSRLVSLGTPVSISWVAPEVLLELRAQDAGARSSPCYWTLTGPTTLALWPTPASSGTLTLRYHRTPPQLTAGSDVPIIPLGYRDILSVGACMMMAQRERQSSAAADFRAEYEERVRDLRAQEGIAQQQTPRIVEPSGFYVEHGCSVTY